tara:strand:+ start:2964 stop:3596 length:633 start_codon:yes stop_codon:yes gene_type:complete
MKNILGINLQDLLKEAVKESVGDIVSSKGSDNEKLKQKQAAHAMKSFKAAKKSKQGIDKDEDKTGTAVDEDEDTAGLINKKSSSEETPDVDLPAIIDLIGSIRSGRSLKDKDVLKDFKIYFKRLNGNERLALYAFLTGISKIMLAPESEDLEKVKKPSSDPYSVQMDREIEKKKSDSDSKSSSKKSDDTPIMIGEAQDKTDILRKLRVYR